MRPLLKHIIEKLLAPLPADSCFVKEKEVISDKLQAQYIPKELSKLLDVSSSLDPRFQLHYVANKDVTLQQLKLEALDIVGGVTDISITSVSPTLVVKKKKGLAGVLKKMIQDETSASSEPVILNDMQRVEKEKDRYFDLPAADPESDLLQWWRNERQHFPILAVLAQNICAYMWDRHAL